MQLTFNDLVIKAGIDPLDVNIVRHTPEPKLRRVFGWVASERPDLFDRYQSTQSPRREAMFQNRKHVASFIAFETGETVFVGMYRIIGGSKTSATEFWAHPLSKELTALGSETFAEDRQVFVLEELDVFKPYHGKLTIEWGNGALAFVQVLGKRHFPIKRICEQSLLVNHQIDWETSIWDYNQLRVLPVSHRHKMGQWRGIYMIFDRSDGLRYIGSACGDENIYQRWMNYVTTNNGGNRLLRGRSAIDYDFSVLELLSPSATIHEVLAKESSWKERLHTRTPFGLNAN